METCINYNSTLSDMGYFTVKTFADGVFTTWFYIGDVFINKLMQTLSRIVNPMQTWLQFLTYIKLLLCRTYCTNIKELFPQWLCDLTFSSFVAFVPEGTCQYDLAFFDKKFEAQWGVCFLHCYIHRATLAVATSVWVCPNQAGTSGRCHVSPSFQCHQLDLCCHFK